MIKKFIKNYPHLTILTLIGFALRAYAIGRNSLWMDEIRQVSYYYSTENIFHLIYKAATQQQPPLDYLIGYTIGNFLPFHEVIARLPALLFGTALIPACYYLFQQVSNPRTGIITAALVTFSPSLVYYSQEARPYSIFLFLLTLTLIEFFRVHESNELQSWKTFRGLAFLILLSRGLEPILALFSLALTFLGLKGLPLSADKNKERLKTLSRDPSIHHFFRSLIQASLWFLPFFILILGKSKKYLSISEPREIHQRTIHFFDPLTYLLQSTLPGTLPSPFLLLSGTAVAGFALCFTKRKAHSRALFLGLFFLLLMTLHTYVFHYSVNSQLAQLAPKYLLYSHIPVLGFSALLVDQLLQWIETKSPAISQRTSWLLLTVLISTFAFYQWPRLAQVYSIHKVDYRAAGKYLQKHLAYGDVILHVSFFPYGSIEHHFWGEGLYYKLPAPIYGLSDLVTAIYAKPDDRKRIFVAIHEAPDQPIVNESSSLSEFSAHGIKIIHLKDNVLSENWGEELETLIDQLLPIFPTNNNAKAKLLLAQCQLLRISPKHGKNPDRQNKAREALTKAQSLAPEIASNPLACPITD